MELSILMKGLTHHVSAMVRVLLTQPHYMSRPQRDIDNTAAHSTGQKSHHVNCGEWLDYSGSRIYRWYLEQGLWER